MTYAKLKSTVRGLLIGDNVLPTDKDPEAVAALVEMALKEIADVCPVLTLTTLDKSENIIALAAGSYMIRMPQVPEKDTDDIDIDDELGSAAARLIASYISKNKPAVHRAEADKLMRNYNGKIYDIQESFKLNSEGTAYDLP